MKTLSIGAEVVVGEAHLVEDQASPSGQQPVEQRVGHGLGLLVDLLGHEVVVAALLGRLEVPVDGAAARARPRLPSSVVTASDAGREHGDLVVGQREDGRGCGR